MVMPIQKDDNTKKPNKLNSCRSPKEKINLDKNEEREMKSSIAVGYGDLLSYCDANWERNGYKNARGGRLDRMFKGNQRSSQNAMKCLLSNASKANNNSRVSARQNLKAH